MLKKWGYALAAVTVSAAVLVPTERAEASYEPTVDTVILVDAKSGRVLFERNIDQPLPPASMTKMMSEYLILEAVNDGDISWDTNVPISDFLASLSHNRSLSNVPLRVDGEYNVEELYESVAIYSANASTMALAELISGSEGAFVSEMNEKGVELGLGTLMREAGGEYGLEDLGEISEEGLGSFQFVNSTGLPNRLLEGNHPEGTGAEEDNYMSARAAATLAYYLVNDYPEVLDVAGIPHKVFREGTGDAIDMPNWNNMIPGTENSHLDYEYVDGLKTGHTNAAGFTFTGTGEKDGQRLVSVVMGADSIEHRFQETQRVLEWGFNTFYEEEIYAAGYSPDGFETIAVSKGEEEEVPLESTEAIHRLIQEGDEELYSYEVVLDEDLLDEDGAMEAPVEAGTVVGQMIISFDGEEDYIHDEIDRTTVVDLITTSDVERSGWFTLMLESIGGFFTGLWHSVTETVRGWL
ncbi:D-alanyl-D-alanine carboxypeptidase family protein [Salisediminibacterium selenitireducens]|uniref:serine-type D-Ala-D-Ala carboxypeptidase n=1 Tax=Bacillus selenitireducens (strain ATCC 700615 / DSM 15326 / MLS10) TaxID=439292 RepID=D6XV05_BACIE|nr:D-alanyl-D-alanine carboxypeptidase family protein [Salisediminibacterium selenitireducens]ADH97563.1 peptidase S11 D-alanyl-D-alanine carboxypeptidase 1 [[Bacillus] selenitireducens MLS10]